MSQKHSDGAIKAADDVVGFILEEQIGSFPLNDKFYLRLAAIIDREAVQPAIKEALEALRNLIPEGPDLQCPGFGCNNGIVPEQVAVDEWEQAPCPECQGLGRVWSEKVVAAVDALAKLDPPVDKTENPK